MIDPIRRSWPRIAARLPLGVNRVSDQALLVQRRRRADRGLRVDQVDARTWVVQRDGPTHRRVRRIGRPGLQADLLVNERASRRDMNQLQKRLGDYLAKEQIAWVLRELGITCVLDVGANVGQYAKMLRRAGYSGRIVSFEPLPHLAAVLRRESSADPDWIVVDCGLGSEDAEVDINVVPGTMSSMLEPSRFGEEWSRTLRDREHRTERIKVRRLDSVFDDAVAGLSDPLVYLKLDTQGFDLQAFEGAGERIGEIHAMQSEVACVPIYDGMPRLPEQLQVYEAAGFEVTGLFPVSRDVPTLRVIEFDVVMVRADAMRGDAVRGDAAAAKQGP